MAAFNFGKTCFFATSDDVRRKAHCHCNEMETQFVICLLDKYCFLIMILSTLVLNATLS